MPSETDNQNDPEEAAQEEPYENHRPGGPEQSAGSGDDAVWTFRGYKLRPGDFNTAMVHLFRAEVSRANVWRQRLDATTNWAVITTGAVLSFAFGSDQTNHLVILLNLVLVTMFLVIESRRYRYYELWSYRVRLMETDFFAPMLVPPFHPSPDWAEALAENLLMPQYSISFWEAMGRRLRRNYLWIYAVIGIAWLTKLWVQPEPVATWEAFIGRAQIGLILGEVVLLVALIFGVAVIAFALLTAGLREATGEVLPRYDSIPEHILASLTGNGTHTTDVRAWYRHTRRRPQLLTFIITDRTKAVSDIIMSEMHRGVTAMPGTGMFTGKEHTVLMCALTITEVSQLKALVRQSDPQAFVVVSPASEIFGGGFEPLEEEEE